MPARPLHAHAGAIVGYVCVALVFAWPLPLHLFDALPGPPSGDTGVYVWNLWVFTHEIVSHRSLPFATNEILSLDAQPVSLSLHNYTTVANLVAFPLLPLLGAVGTFNVLMIGSGILTAYAMFLYAWKRTGDSGAAFAGGLLFGFSPFMTARSMEHFSLVQAAPLPVFGMLMLHIFQYPSTRIAVYAGLVVAWAFLSDPYYAVYCLLIALFTIGYSVVAVERRPEAVQRVWWSAALNLLLLCLGGLIAGILVRGGGRFEVLGLRVSMTRLYTPVLIFTLLLAVRVWWLVRPRVRWPAIYRLAHVRAALIAGAVCAAALAPLLAAMGSAADGPAWHGPRVWWRSSAPGVDAAAWLLPNPMNPWFGDAASSWLSTLPNGMVENVAAVSWVAIGTVVVAAAVARFRGPAGWWCFTGFFALLSLGPFIHVAGINTYVPTPWALLRYLPVIGAARMPTRLTVLVMLGVSMVLALAVQHLRSRSRRPAAVLAVVAALLLAELLPAPRRVFSAAVPGIYRVIAADPRPVRVLHLPAGLKDGLSNRGRFSTRYQYYQTVHEKPLIGGYLSRLPPGAMDRYAGDSLLGALLDLSEGRELDPATAAAALAEAPAFVSRRNVGYVVVNTTRASEALIAFATQAFGLTLVTVEGNEHLYQTALPTAGADMRR
jgi:hypothetical protein